MRGGVRGFGGDEWVSGSGEWVGSLCCCYGN